MSRRFRIALLIESSRTYGRELLRGIGAFGREHGNWTFFQEERSLGTEAPSRLRRWRPDGVLARLADARLLRQARQLKVPVVDLYHEEEIAGIPGVCVNQDVLIRMAVTHFLERGFRVFGYCGFAGVLFSELREAGFLRQLADQGHQAHVFRYPPLAKPNGLSAIEAHAMRYSSRLAGWLRELPKPAAVLACNDVRGQQVLDVCSEAGIAVPNEVAVLGVDNDDVSCELTSPSLSSIDLNAETIGYQAASLLQRLLDGHRAPPCKILIDPLRVVTRQSTDVLAVADRDVAEVIRLVRQHATDGANLKTMLSQLRFSRSTLERWFRRYFGHSLTDEILRLRVNRAAELLATTDYNIEKISHLAGFAHVESMSRIFKRTQGLPPGQYRTKRRGKGDW